MSTLAVHAGSRPFPFVAAGAVASNDLIEFGSDAGGFVGVATKDGVAGDTVPLDIDGVYELTKEAPLVIAQGDLLYYDAATGEVTKTALNNRTIGFAWMAAASADTTVQVKLKGHHSD